MAWVCEGGLNECSRVERDVTIEVREANGSTNENGVIRSHKIQGK